jgi:hypothetical protein
MFVPSYIPILVSYSLGDDNEDEIKHLNAHIPLYDSIEHEPTPTPQLSIWVHSNREANGDLVGDPSYQHHTHS